jgi:hypothetical protein
MGLEETPILEFPYLALNRISQSVGHAMPQVHDLGCFEAAIELPAFELLCRRNNVATTVAHAMRS